MNPTDAVLEELRTLVEPIIDRSKDQVGTHYPNCHEYHVACLAVLVSDTIEDGLKS